MAKLPYNINLKQNATSLRKAGNLSEALLWSEIKNKKLMKLSFNRQKIIGNYIIDFYCPSARLVIEIDGRSHEVKGEYDKARDAYLKEQGLTVVHLRDIDVRKNMESVLAYLEGIIKNTPSASPPPL